MNFAEKLNIYIEELGCSGKELSNISGVPISTISRYRNAQSTPTIESEVIIKLANGIADIAGKRKLDCIDSSSVADSLRTAIAETKEETDYIFSSDNFSILTRELEISLSRLAEYTNYDVSHLARIRSGERTPRNPLWLAQSSAKYVIENHSTEEELYKAARFLGVEVDYIRNTSRYQQVLSTWLLSFDADSRKSMKELLYRLDRFDVTDYVRDLRLDDVKILHFPIRLATTKLYSDINGLEKCVVDFLYTTITSPKTKEITIYTDIPIDFISENNDFFKKWMLAMAALIKKGCRINVIHNVDRPLNEMIMGLKAWIPVYMSGLVTPYYLEGSKTSVFQHLLMVSGGAAATGEAIAGHSENGEYKLTTIKKQVLFYSRKASFLVSHSDHLLDIYNKDRKNDFNDFFEKITCLHGDRTAILSAPPIGLISEGLLMRMLERSQLPSEDIRNIKNYVEKEKKYMQRICEGNTFTVRIPHIEKSEFEDHPPMLSLSGMFFENDVYYSYDEFMEHIDHVRKVAEDIPNLKVEVVSKHFFRNIQIVITQDDHVVISRNKSPAIHFVMQNKKNGSCHRRFV